MQGLIDQGKKDGVEFNEKEYERSRPILEAIVKGLIGRDIYDQSIYSRVVSPFDPIYSEAIRIITDPALYNSYLTPPAAE